METAADSVGNQTFSFPKKINEKAISKQSDMALNGRARIQNNFSSFGFKRGKAGINLNEYVRQARG
jgi:hypothetical protein